MVDTVLLVLFVVLAGIFTTLLFLEYRSCIFHMEQLQDVKEKYRTKIQLLKRVINDFTPQEQEYCEILDLEKKNDDQQADTFLVLNRCPDYLRKSTIEYIREQNLQTVLNRIDDDQWRYYTEQIVQEEKKAQQKKKRTLRIVKSSQQKKIAARTDIYLAWPIKRSRFWLSSFFGPRKNPNGTWRFHKGVDMAALKGTVVKAAAPGKVTVARYISGYGKTVVITHNKKYKTRYAHLHEILVHNGQSIARGQLIGKVGSTGFVRGKDPSHLHFELYIFGKQVNPMPFLT